MPTLKAERVKRVVDADDNVTYESLKEPAVGKKKDLINWSDPDQTDTKLINVGDTIYVKVTLVDEDTSDAKTYGFDTSRDGDTNWPKPVDVNESRFTDIANRPHGDIVEWTRGDYSATQLIYKGVLRELPYVGMPPRYRFMTAVGGNTPVTQTLSGSTTAVAAGAEETIHEVGQPAYKWDYNFNTRGPTFAYENRTIKTGVTYQIGHTIADEQELNDLLWVRKRLNWLLGEDEPTWWWTFTRNRTFDSDGDVSAYGEFVGHDLIAKLKRYLDEIGVKFTDTIDGTVFTALRINTKNSKIVGPPTAATQSKLRKQMFGHSFKDEGVKDILHDPAYG